jgi:cell division protein FtsQ
MPVDVKLMNITASVLFVAGAPAAAGGAGLVGAAPSDVRLGGITVQGDVTHNNAVTLRANVAPRLAGNFFTVDLGAARAAFESVPWVRRRWCGASSRTAARGAAGAPAGGLLGRRRRVAPGQHLRRGVRGQPGRRRAGRPAAPGGPDGAAAQVLAMYRG